MDEKMNENASLRAYAEMSVWKYKIEYTEYVTITIPSAARILCAKVQEDGVYIWVLVSVDAERVERTFRILKTGETSNNAPGELHYIDTILLAGGKLVYHIFEVMS